MVENYGSKDRPRYLYRRYTIPSWKRRSSVRVTVVNTNDFPKFKGLDPDWGRSDADKDISKASSLWGYQIFIPMGMRKISDYSDVIEEVFYNGETLAGAIFYADLKAIDMGFNVGDPFLPPDL
tara:strand:- start:357 stop:725 length:369 start_codon:yes stop_codon:yes gene_type:complete